MKLEIKNISKNYKHKKAVKNISISLQEGVHGLLGANGSGKTTLFKVLCGLLDHDGEGDITFDGASIEDQYDTYIANVGYMPQHFGYYPSYTVEEFLFYMGVVKGLQKEYIRQRINELLIQLNLAEKCSEKMKSLSGGMLRRVGIAQALLNEPKILILDEPTAGLDPKERIIFRNLIASLSKSTIILLSTHIVSDVESIADDILVMKDGNIILNDSCENLLQTMNGKVWETKVDSKEARQLMDQYIIVKSHQLMDGTELRIVSDEKPHETAKSAMPDLDDLYLYHFEEESFV